jgi:hypothetical protein
MEPELDIMFEVRTLEGMAAPTQPLVALFPKALVEACLEKALTAIVTDQAQVSGASLPSSGLSTAHVDIDSLCAVEILCVLDEHLPFLLTESVVRPGGYRSITEGVTHLTSGAEAKWNDYHKE